MNYFELFSLPKKFKINKVLLSQNFYKLQSIYHPDLFIESDKLEKNFLKKTMEINKGYQILKNFLSRAKYFLYLHGFNSEDSQIFSNKNNCLSEYFFFYEELELIKQSGYNQEKFYSFDTKISDQIKKHKKNITIALDDNKWIDGIHMISELLFLLKIQTSLKKEKHRYLR